MSSLRVVRPMGGETRPAGDLAVRKLERGDGSAHRAPAWPPMPAFLPFKYKVRTFWLELLLHLRIGWVGLWRGLVAATGVIATARLYLTVYRADGRVEHLGLVSTKLITDTGVAFLVDDWDNNGQDLTTMNFHGIGTGTNAENQTDSALQTESTTNLNPNDTRATGTRSQPAANQYRSVGTLTADGAIACTEHGIFSQAATGGGVLWDRSVFSVVNLASGDSLQATYTCTVSAGG
jgi:hypothetical protein